MTEEFTKCAEIEFKNATAKPPRIRKPRCCCSYVKAGLVINPKCKYNHEQNEKIKSI